MLTTSNKHETDVNMGWKMQEKKEMLEDRPCERAVCDRVVCLCVWKFVCKSVVSETVVLCQKVLCERLCVCERVVTRLCVKGYV